MWVYRQDDPRLGIKRFIGSDQAFANATGGTAAAISGLSFPVSAGRAYQINLYLITTGVSGGGKISISGPAAPALLKMTTKGLTAGVTAFSTDTVTALDTLGAAYNTTAVTGALEVSVTITPTVSGNVTFNAANVTNTNSFAVLAGSFGVMILLG